MAGASQTWVVELEAFGLDGPFGYVGELPEPGDVIEVTRGGETISARVESVDPSGMTHQIKASEAGAA